jgi:hypothetical protein
MVQDSPKNRNINDTCHIILRFLGRRLGTLMSAGGMGLGSGWCEA